MKFKSVRYGFKKFTEFYRDEVEPIRLKYSEFEGELRDILLSENSKYDLLRDALLISNIPAILLKEIKKEDIELDPTYFKIEEVRYNPNDLNYTTYTFRIRYYLKSEDKLVETQVKSRIALGFFDSYINGKEDEEVVD